MYTDTVTVFNKRKTESGDVWYPSVLTGVQLIIDKAANQAKTGLEGADTVRLHIAYQFKDGDKYISGKRYIQPKAWRSLVDVAGTVTFAEGESFFLCMAYPEEPEPDDGRLPMLERMKQAYDDCFIISSVGVYSLIPHFEIGGN